MNKIQQQQLQLVTNSDCANTTDAAISSEIEDDFLGSGHQSSGGTKVTPENIMSAYISTTANTSSLDDLHESTLLENVFLEHLSRTQPCQQVQL